MQKIVRQVAGIDVAQSELVVSLGRLLEDLSAELFASKTFPNNRTGFVSLLAWVKKLSDGSVPVRFVMEATGVYHESLAYFLADQGRELSVVLPNKISNYFRTLEVKTITDKTSAQAIARFGLERKLDQWQKPKPVFKRLRQLTRERDQLVQQRTVIKNQLHAEQSESEPYGASIQRMKKHIELLNQHIQQVEREITVQTRQEEAVNKSIRLLCSISGIGQLTAATILAETNGFELIRNKRQLTSYAGLDVREKQSGTSVKGKSRISKKGNKYLRKAMYMPSLAAIRHDERFKAIHARLVAKHGIKMKGVVAVQRKLLEMAYTIYKSQQPYSKSYLENQEKEIAEAL